MFLLIIIKKSVLLIIISGLFKCKPLEGKDGVLAPLIKRLVEAGLNEEMNAHLSEDKRKNRHNSKTGKQVKTSLFNKLCQTENMYL